MGNNSGLNEYVCQTCNLFTNIADQGKAKAFHRKFIKEHAPDLVTVAEWNRKLEKGK
ncbi:hypothetical protein HWB79_gp132 [Streptomyces phage LukeCage]|jgi:hypothetical protein|uniref:Uncharacterized protein n=1 Tax=Streptomyces phage LukeCage TaxID=2283304 RepID=A0A345MGJ8_9CAUD|nr:hypothetical protein HWB79_gp132 [Streptomyces phage LukeCage]AXH69679.1 hypothetical protein SEA_LUKECAGE_190 [Streptomyces phage LukeCage]